MRPRSAADSKLPARRDRFAIDPFLAGPRRVASGANVELPARLWPPLVQLTAQRRVRRERRLIGAVVLIPDIAIIRSGDVAAIARLRISRVGLMRNVFAGSSVLAGAFHPGTIARKRRRVLGQPSRSPHPAGPRTGRLDAETQVYGFFARSPTKGLRVPSVRRPSLPRFVSPRESARDGWPVARDNRGGRTRVVRLSRGAGSPT